MPLQSFLWGEFSHHDCAQQRSYYKSFTLQDESYSTGACCLFFPDVAGQPLYVGRILSAFADCSPDAADVHCIEVRWFEHVSKLDPNCAGNKHEVIELAEGCDLNPLGSLAGKTIVLRAHSLQEAERLAHSQGLASASWFYSRGVFKQSSNEFLLHGPCPASEHAMQVERPSTPPALHTFQFPGSTAAGLRKGRGSSCQSDAEHTSQNKKQRLSREATPECSTQQHSSELHSSLQQQQQQQQAVSDKPDDKQCVECGATQTPQWREGPAGPKTLCNACGVRFNRLRANKKGGCFTARSASSRQKASKPSAAAQSKRSPQEKQRQSVSAGLCPKPTPLPAAAPDAVSPAPGAAFALGAPEEHGTPSLQSVDSVDEQLLLSCLLEAAPSGGAGAGGGGGFEGLEGLVPSGGAAAHVHGATGSVEMARAASAASCMASALFEEEGTAPLGCRGDTQQDSMQHTSSRLASFASLSSAASLAPASSLGAAQVTPSSSSAACSALRGVALKAVHYCPDAAEFGQVFSRFEALHPRLPAGSLQLVAGLMAQVEAAANEAADADAALQAVLQMVAERQQAADRARDTAASAADAFKGCMADLLRQQQQQQQQPGCLSSRALPPLPSADSCGLEALQQELCLWGPPALQQELCPWGPPALQQELCPWEAPSLQQDDLDSLDGEHLSLMDREPLFFGAADCGASLLGMDCSFASAMALMVQH